MIHMKRGISVRVRQGDGDEISAGLNGVIRQCGYIVQNVWQNWLVMRTRRKNHCGCFRFPRAVAGCDVYLT